MAEETTGAAGAQETGAASGTTAETTTETTETGAAKETSTAANTVLSSEEIQKLIQRTVDTRTAELGKKIGTLQKENEQLKKANMTAEELKKAEHDEFEKQKAEVELQKRQIHAHGVVAKAGYGDDVESVVNFVLGDTDENTSERLQAFKELVDKIVAAQVEQTFKTNGRNPNGGGNHQTDDNKSSTIAEKIGKQRAEQAAKSNEILKHYLGGKG